MIQNDEKEFIDSLPSENYKKKYILEKKKIIKNIKKKYKDIWDTKEKQFRNKIEIEKEHRVMLNKCIYPFISSGPLSSLDYIFVTVSPLAELDEKNFDFLLFKKTRNGSIAIFGECKSSISKPRNLFKELRDRVEVLMKNLEYIRNTYLKLPASYDLSIEIVIASTPRYAHDLCMKIIENKENFEKNEIRYIIWQVERFSPSIKMLLPPKKNVDIDPELMKHKDPALKKELLNGVETSQIGPVDIYPGIHSALKLSPIIKLLSNEDGSLIFRRIDLEDLILKNLPNFNEEYRSKIVNKIIEDGSKIDIFEKTDDENIFKLKIREKNREKIQDRIIDKWIKMRIQEEIRSEIQRQLLQLQEEIKRKIPQRTLKEF